MRENKVRAIWQVGGAAVNGWLHIGSPFSAEVMAHAGWDSLTIDIQHGPVDFTLAVPMIQAIGTTDTTVFARVPWNEPGIIMKLLDAGCYGIICPMVNSRAEAEAFVGACRYPPLGFRSHGPTRVSLWAGSDYAANANQTVVTMAMIETAKALDNLDDILSTPGLDAIYIGPADLAQSLGYPPRADHTDPKMVEIMDHILASAKRHGIVPGLHTLAPAYARQMIEKGYQFVTIASDGRLLTSASQEALKVARGTTAVSQAAPSGPY